MSVYIIAEAGSTHDQRSDKFEMLIKTAAECGANAVKFQYWSSPIQMRKRRKILDGKTYSRGSIPRDWLDSGSQLAHELGLDFMCTSYLPEDIPTVARYVDKFKVSSFESQDKEFLIAHEEYRKPMIISLGMGGRRIIPARCEEFHFLHCVSAYPVPISQANLSAITGMCDGYSDHTKNAVTGAVAVGAGASILEVHYRLDNTLPTCPDYVVSLTPKELFYYIAMARDAAVMMDSDFGVQPCEMPNQQYRVGVDNV